MAKTRMAPIVSGFLRELRRQTETGWLHGYHVPRADAELRALLRVARAAKRVEEGDATDFSAEIALSRALSALDRVSGRQRKGGAR